MGKTRKYVVLRRQQSEAMQERAAIVSWLRATPLGAISAALDIASAIERGEHEYYAALTKDASHAKG